MYDLAIIRKYLGLSVLIFGIGCIGGYLMAAIEPSFGEALLKVFKDMVASEIMSSEPPVLAVQLFLNNLQACVLLFIGGAALGLVSLFILSFNGIIIGAILQVVGSKEGAMVVLAAIVPHGLFELPAIFVSATLGFILGRAVLAEMQGTGDSALEASGLGKMFVMYVIPFVGIAACIEAFITPVVLQMVT